MGGGWPSQRLPGGRATGEKLRAIGPETVDRDTYPTVPNRHGSDQQDGGDKSYTASQQRLAQQTVRGVVPGLVTVEAEQEQKKQASRLGDEEAYDLGAPTGDNRRARSVRQHCNSCKPQTHSRSLFILPTRVSDETQIRSAVVPGGTGKTCYARATGLRKGSPRPQDSASPRRPKARHQLPSAAPARHQLVFPPPGNPQSSLPGLRSGTRAYLPAPGCRG